MTEEVKQDSTRQQATLEAEEFSRARIARRRLLPQAMLVGLLAGGVAVLFRKSLDGGDFVREALLNWAHGLGIFGWAVAIAFSGTLAVLGVWLVRRYAPEAAGSGIPHLEAVLTGYRNLNWKRLLPVKFFGGVFAIASGMALGREGPTVQMGGAVGQAVGSFRSTDTQDTVKTLTAAGAGAGLAAAFNAPLAGLIFVLEELQKDFRPGVFGAAFIAAVAGDSVTRLFDGPHANFQAPSFQTPALNLLPAFALLGVACGVLGVLFNRGLMAALDWLPRKTHTQAYITAGLLGGAVGALAFNSPDLVGSGHTLVEAGLHGAAPLVVIPLWLLVRFVLTLTNYGTGAAGGIFAPLLAIGSTAGLGFGLVTQNVVGQGVVPGAFAAVGMAAIFAAVVRAPLTGIVLIVEMTSSYSLMLPLLASCLLAYLVAEGLRQLPVYEELLQRDLAKGGLVPESSEEPLHVTIEVKPGSTFSGKSLRELGLPRGVVLVGVRENGREVVPDANTILQPHSVVTAVISPDAEGGLEAMRAGCEER